MELIDRVDYFSIYNRNLVELLKVELINRVENSTTECVTETTSVYGTTVKSIDTPGLRYADYSMANPPQDVSHSSTGQELHVLIAGLPRTGKSTGLNNIFDLDFPAGTCATPITTRVKSFNTRKNGIPLKVTDVPGLTAANTTIDDITLKDMKDVGRKNTFLLLLTLPVDKKITKDYYNILKNLTTIFGPEVWDWCLILLTFSDNICSDEFPSEELKHYHVDYLREYCMELQKVLQATGARKPVKLFEYANFKAFQDKSVDTIVALPISKDPTFSTKKLFPLLPWTHKYQWTDLAFMEISKINDTIPQASFLRSYLIQLRYGYFTLKEKLAIAALAAASGAAGGALMGAGIGTVAAPGLGTALGSLIGGVVGGISGAFGGTTGATAIIAIAYMSKVNRERNQAQ